MQTQLQCPACPIPIITASTVFSATRNGVHNLELWLWRVQASNRDLLYTYSVLCVTNLICNRIAKFSASCRWMPSGIFIVYCQCWSERQFCKQLVVFVASVGDVWQQFLEVMAHADPYLNNRLTLPGKTKTVIIIIIHSFYIALFSALEQTQCAHVACDSQ